MRWEYSLNNIVVMICRDIFLNTLGYKSSKRIEKFFKTYECDDVAHLKFMHSNARLFRESI